MFGVSMDSLGPPDQRLMDTFWIQIIQVKISGKNLDHKKIAFCEIETSQHIQPRLVCLWIPYVPLIYA